MKRIISIILICAFAFSLTAAVPKNETGFTDVPKGHYFEEYINKLKELGITYGDGKGNFGFNRDITRAEFLTFLIRLQGLPLDKFPNKDMFKDVKATDWFYPYINMGLKSKVILKNDYASNSFLPTKPITREEMAVMIVRAMKYDDLAAEVSSQPSQFKDVKQRIGYIEVAKDLGIINGRSTTLFDPAAKATKQEAAAMLIRMYNNNQNKLDMVNGFYAIQSFKQVDKIKSFDSISYGWSRLDYNQQTGQVELSSVKKTGGQPFYVPDDYQAAVSEASSNLVTKYLMIFGTNEDSVVINGVQQKLVSALLSNEGAADKLANDIAAMTENLDAGSGAVQFDGVVVDFEGLKDNGMDKQGFVSFLTKLNSLLDAKGKQLLVCVNPAREAGQPYYNGYDFAAIGKLADYVILMAHDYETKSLSTQEMQYFKGETPLASIKDVYYAIKLALNNGAGVPKDKLLLQMNFSAAQWQFKDGKVINNVPYNPDYSKILARMKDPNTVVKSFNYSEKYQAPYFIYEADGVKNMIWYEDERSIAAKLRLAKMFGLEGVSFWRLGLIPNNAAPEDAGYKLNIMGSIEQLNAQ